MIPMPPPNVTGYLHMGHAMFVALQVHTYIHMAENVSRLLGYFVCAVRVAGGGDVTLPRVATLRATTVTVTDDGSD